MIKVFPILFIILWSSAFITTKPIIDNSDPFSALAFRFLIVTFIFFLFSLLTKKNILISKKYLLESILSGILFHGIYLGGVFFAISIGMPTAISALIVTLQPVLTGALSGLILKEKVSINQWFGILLGFIGTALVLGLDVGSNIPALGVITSIIALVSITTSTIWQKKLSNNLPLSVSNMYQALGGFLFHLLIISIFIKPHINFSKTFLISMSYQIFIVSFGAFTILMLLIKKNSVSKTVSFFFLIPPTSALMAWIFLDEKLTNLDIIGFLIATIGVYIATRD